MQEFNINYTISKENWISIMAETEEDAKEELLRLYRGEAPIHSENQIYSREAVTEGAEWTNDLTINSYNMSTAEEIEYFTEKAEYAKSMANNDNLLSDIQRLYQRQYERCLAHIEKLNKIQDERKIVVDLEGIGKATATAVKKEEGKTWYVFDGTVGNSTMNDADSFLSNLVTKFPKDLRDRLSEIRFLDASEIFSDCDDPDEWKWLMKVGVKMEEPQIPYFKSADHRKVGYRLDNAWAGWWLRSVTSEYLFIFVGSGGARGSDAFDSFGVRPLFVLNDTED